MRDRLTFIDILKTIAILGVLVIHATSTAFVSYEPISAEYIFTVFISCIARISVPTFVMCSGAVFLAKNKTVTIRQIYTKYIPRIICALLLFSVFYEVVLIFEFYSYTGVFDLSVIQNSIHKLLTFNTYFHLYYLYIVVILYALVPVIKTYLQASTQKTDFYLLSFLFFTANLLPTLRMHYPFDRYFGGMTLQYSMNLVYGMLSYFFLGYYLSTYELSRCKRIVIVVLGVLGAIVTFSGTGIYRIYTDKLTENYINAMSVNVYFMAAAIFVVMKKLSVKLKSDKAKSFYACISNASFTIYLIHQFYNIVFARLGLTLTTATPFVTFPVIVILDFIFSFITYLLFKRIPIIKKLV